MTWADVLAHLEAAPAGTRRSFARAAMPHPREAGAVVGLGLPVAGKIDDWRFPPTGSCHGLHIHEHADCWVAHLDQVHPACDAVEHLRVDAPRVYIAAASALGALVGALARGTVGGIVGGLVGGLFGRLFTIPRSTP